MATLPQSIVSLDNKPQMAFWDIEIGTEKSTDFLKKFIKGFSVEYNDDGPPVAQLHIVSNSYIEDILVQGVPIKFYLGWDRLRKALMIDGKIITPPDGRASEKLTYTLTIADKAMDMSKKTNNRIFKTLTKQSIISKIARLNNYDYDISIKGGTNKINPKEMPIQKNETDLNFLYRCAVKWNCVIWFAQDKQTKRTRLYFYDASEANSKGNLLRTSSVNDLDTDYILGYRTSDVKNNVAYVAFKNKKNQGGVSGSPGVKGATESGTVAKPFDFDFEADGGFWKLKKSIDDEIKTNSSLGVKYIRLVAQAQTSKSRDKLREYFVPVTHASETNKNISHAPANKRGSVALEVGLNVGDPFLRAPRTGKLHSGSLTEDSDLPAFLFRDGKPQRYNINKVRTSLNNGMIQTQLVAEL